MKSKNERYYRNVKAKTSPNVTRFHWTPIFYIHTEKIKLCIRLNTYFRILYLLFQYNMAHQISQQKYKN